MSEWGLKQDHPENFQKTFNKNAFEPNNRGTLPLLKPKLMNSPPRFLTRVHDNKQLLTFVTGKFLNRLSVTTFECVEDLGRAIRTCDVILICEDVSGSGKPVNEVVGSGQVPVVNLGMIELIHF